MGSKIKGRADPEAKAGDIRVIQVGETFDQVQADDGEDIIDADAAFYIRFPTQHVGGCHSVREREFHLAGVDHRIVLIAETAIQELAGNDLTKPKSFQSGDLVKKEPVKEMVDIDSRIVIAHEFPDIHHIVGILGIEIRLVARMNDEQGEGQVAAQVTGI